MATATFTATRLDFKPAISLTEGPSIRPVFPNFWPHVCACNRLDRRTPECFVCPSYRKRFVYTQVKDAFFDNVVCFGISIKNMPPGSVQIWPIEFVAKCQHPAGFFNFRTGLCNYVNRFLHSLLRRQRWSCQKAYHSGHYHCHIDANRFLFSWRGHVSHRTGR